MRATISATLDLDLQLVQQQNLSSFFFKNSDEPYHFYLSAILKKRFLHDIQNNLLAFEI
jgi:hypothetical protein